MSYLRKNVGTCSHSTEVTLTQDGTIEGMKAEEAIARMKGVKCGSKGTSCPEQIAFALEEALAAQK